MNTAPQPPPSFFVSRFYSLVKRLALGLFLNGTIAIIEMFAFYGLMDEEYLGSCLLVQLAIVPVALVLWSLLAPRRYVTKPSFLLIILYISLFFIDYFVTIYPLFFAVWWINQTTMAI